MEEWGQVHTECLERRVDTERPRRRGGAGRGPGQAGVGERRERTEGFSQATAKPDPGSALGAGGRVRAAARCQPGRSATARLGGQVPGIHLA